MEINTIFERYVKFYSQYALLVWGQWGIYIFLKLVSYAYEGCINRDILKNIIYIYIYIYIY